jgi:hypothetical protein
VKGGRGQPLSLTLLFGNIPWFNVRAEIQRCDWLKSTHSLEIHAGHVQKTRFRPIIALYFPPYTKPRNFAKR